MKTTFFVIAFKFLIVEATEEKTLIVSVSYTNLKLKKDDYLKILNSKVL